MNIVFIIVVTLDVYLNFLVARFFRFDEFGFRVEEEDGPEQSSRKLLSQPLTEDPIHK